jgi:hypothetical protein
MLARGSFTDTPTLVSSEFARKLWDSMKQIGVVETAGKQTGKMSLQNLREMLKNG